MMIIVRHLVCAAAIGLLWICMGPARAEGSMLDLLMGKVAPLTIIAKDMTPEWKKMSVETINSGQPIDLTAAMYSEYRHMRSYRGGSVLDMLPNGTTTYFTKGDLFTCQGESYLIAYRTEQPGSDVYAEKLIHQVMTTGQGPDAASRATRDSYFVTADTPLYLCLLNLRTVAGLYDVRPAPTPAELEQAAAERLRAISMDNLQQLAMTVMMYAQENDEQLPVFATATDFGALSVDQATLHHPVTQALYHINQTLSGKSLGEIQNPEKMPLFYEATPWPNGQYLVAFVDGHVAAQTKEQWAALQEKWKLQ